MISIWEKFRTNQAGQVAVIFGIALIPLIFSVGLSADYANLSLEKARLQNEVDTLALERRGGAWESETVYRVSKSRPVPTYFLALMGKSSIVIDVAAQVNVLKPTQAFIPPMFQNLDNSAGDYNRAVAYCFDPVTSIRGELHVIADNVGNVFKPAFSCPKGTAIHYGLLNDWSRLAYQKFGGECTPANYYFECHIDLYLHDSGKKNENNIPNEFQAPVETILCDKLSDCIKQPCLEVGLKCLRYQSEGGLIPKGAKRAPNQENRACTPGKFMYYGWEDTRDELGGDSDYNDLTFIVSCPDNNDNAVVSLYLSR